MTKAGLIEQVVRRTERLASIPAPPLEEHDRAAVVEEWWSTELHEVSIDEVGNVWGRVRGGRGPALVVAAHLDTVFGVDVHHGTEHRGGRLYGPSVGDDSVAVASLAALDALLPDDPGGPVWVVATVGEEGLGNLTGIRHAISNPRTDIGAVIAIEGNWLGRVCLTGVGSRRFRVTLDGPGGHAWEASEVDSAVHGVARIIAAIDAAPRPENSRTAVNVGRVGGGTAINARADCAWFEIDLRAITQEALDALTATAEMAVRDQKADLVASWASLGDRPAGGLDPAHPLALAAFSALTDAGLDMEVTEASTDANAAHAAGIPALAIGITVGSEEHTIREWIELEPIGAGLDVLAATVMTYLRSIR
ncbi:MAG: M20/M25/M40 family metallo-hydrolase [Acidimicrobiales bacterium]|nr:M20/M25/M40 family metallo-hydrolase [Acidimicrobiales bacterium]